MGLIGILYKIEFPSSKIHTNYFNFSSILSEWRIKVVKTYKWTGKLNDKIKIDIIQRASILIHYIPHKPI